VSTEPAAAQWASHQINVRNRVVKSVEATKRFILSSCKAWCGKPIATIREADIGAVLSAKRDSGKKHSANRLYAHLRSLFKWAKRNKLVPTNEALEIEMPWQASVRARRRKRDWFSGEKADAVLRAVWRAADAFGGNRGRFIKTAIITGKRINTVRDMSWNDIDGAWFWRPPYEAENKRNQAVPLPALAQRLLSPRQPRGPVFNQLDPQHLMLLVRDRPNVPQDFIWHGLRHIMRTKLAELRVPADIAEMVCDHPDDGDADAGYDHHSYKAEMLEALETWCAYLERMLQPSEQVAVLR
jgi:integrase